MNTKFAIWRLIVRFEKGGGILTLNLIAITTLHKAVTRDGGGAQVHVHLPFPLFNPPPHFFYTDKFVPSCSENYPQIFFYNNK